MLFHRQFTDIAGLTAQVPTAEELARIRTLIANAVAHEAGCGLFLKVLRLNFPRLHSAIALTDGDGRPDESPEALLSFVVSYIRHVPDFIEAVDKIGEAAGIRPITNPFLRIAEEFFLSPPELVEGHTGLHALLDEAYLAHRIIEEVNDQVIARCGVPLAPMDMTKANLVVHSLIGEPFANDLDHAVQYSVEMLLMQGSALDHYLASDSFRRYAGQHRQLGWGEELAQYPALVGQLPIDLRFVKAGDYLH